MEKRHKKSYRMWKIAGHLLEVEGMQLIHITLSVSRYMLNDFFASNQMEVEYS